MSLRKARLSRTTKKTLAKKKQAREREEIDQLNNAIAAWDPSSTPSRFDQLPISKATVAALKQAKFEEMTAIQRAAIPVALGGRSLVATAKTGTGKTLAFLVPLVERLHREQWARENGVGAIVVSPTRELAVQTFEVLKLVGAHHKLHGGLMIGRGLDLQEERANAAMYSVIVATPGRLLQHLDEASELRTDQLQMIVFDECDRLLEMGFDKTIHAILGHLPSLDRLQCLLFSATNDKKVIAERLGGVDFLEVDPHKMEVPGKLRHFAMRVSLEQKLTMLWSFIKQHMFSKVMVFVASCKQARFLEEVLRRLQAAPAWIAAIHGRLQQTKRMAKYYEFRKLKHGILICTDVAARGLDFPAVDWVVQMDIPESVEAYIHRVGRTARLGGEGSALLFVMPSESNFVAKLGQRGIKLDFVEPKQRKLDDPTPQLQSLLCANPDLKHLAQKAFVCYLRSLSLAACDVSSLPYKAFSQSLGLITIPKIKLGKSRREEKNAPFALRDKGDDKEQHEVEAQEDDLLVSEPEMNAKKRRKLRRMLEKKEIAEKKRRTQEEDALAALGAET